MKITLAPDFIIPFMIGMSMFSGCEIPTITPFVAGDGNIYVGGQVPDTGNLSAEDTGIEDTGVEDTGVEDTGIQDTGIQDTGSEDTAQ